ncbi:uncharacterized protein LOC106175828 [Lingula anatina]|uniref:Uncharacterized protein LOC106175828 n=1 Tax=Lingula anatina TaxID=7574 RepID=A0A1S3JSV9_LINAN|nr:uncharacterized protein LOC106175828 [Lingula anatina]XP_013413437.1 uncharacterized protein LOC106175828 [Lingula anatina]XP_013413438.1 uncharacterized protein LOC106175828 [Lingula anatina]|eukprot:XP_013413436.1 uncharacterized protein LOC106175828 [Lingula anatina]
MGDMVLAGRTQAAVVSDGQNQAYAIRKEQAVVTEIAPGQYGIVTQQQTVYISASQQNLPALQYQPAGNAPVIVQVERDDDEDKCICCESCCTCSGTWYSFHGKGFFPVCMMVVFYIIFGVLVLALYCCWCILCAVCKSSDD